MKCIITRTEMNSAFINYLRQKEVMMPQYIS